MRGLSFFSSLLRTTNTSPTRQRGTTRLPATPRLRGLLLRILPFAAVGLYAEGVAFQSPVI